MPDLSGVTGEKGVGWVRRLESQPSDFESVRQAFKLASGLCFGHSRPSPRRAALVSFAGAG